MIEKYLESKQYAWSPTTIKTVRAKLNAVQHLLKQAPEQAYEEMKGKYGAYTIKQYLIIMDGYRQWETKGKDTRFKSFLKQNARLFRSAYDKKKVALSYSEAARRINTIQDDTVRRSCHFLLRSGVRISEASKCSDTVVGKGNKVRKVFVEAPDSFASVSQIRRALGRLGLKPHDLRKLCATRLVNKGAAPQDLCEIMGWSSIETAYRYLQPSKDSKLKELMNGDS